MGSSLSAVVKGKTIPHWHDSERSSCTKKQRSQLLSFWRSVSTDSAHSKIRNTGHVGSSQPYAKTWLGSKSREEKPKESRKPRAAALSVSVVCTKAPSHTAHPWREPTAAFTDQSCGCSGPTGAFACEIRTTSLKMSLICQTQMAMKKEHCHRTPTCVKHWINNSRFLSIKNKAKSKANYAGA